MTVVVILGSWVVRCLSPEHPCARGRLPVPADADEADLGYCKGIPDGQCTMPEPPSGRVAGNCLMERMTDAWQATDGGGKVLWSGSYSKHGARVGRWKMLDDDGHISHGDYSDGYPAGRHGQWTYWTTTTGGGMRRHDGKYDHGERVGTWTERDPDGTLLSEVEYKAGELDGRATLYCGNGWTIEYSYSAGTGVVQVLRQNFSESWSAS